MRQLISPAILSVVAAGLLLVVPSTSFAQHRDHDHGPRPGVYNGRHDHGRYGGSYYGRDFGRYYGWPTPGYGNYYGRRPVVVHPTYQHWTPYRGWHEHGHIHVPHRGHYHTIPY